jgi:hypothetical protein
MQRPCECINVLTYEFNKALNFIEKNLLPIAQHRRFQILNMSASILIPCPNRQHNAKGRSHTSEMFHLVLISCADGDDHLPPTPISTSLQLQSLLPPLAAPAVGGRGTSFLCSNLVFRARVCLLWCVVGVVGAAATRINLAQLYSRTSVDLYDSVSEFMVPCAC